MQMAPDSRGAKITASAPSVSDIAAQPKVEARQEAQSQGDPAAPSQVRGTSAQDADESKIASALFQRIDMPPLQGSVEALAQEHEAPASAASTAYAPALGPNWVDSIDAWQEPRGTSAQMNNTRRRYRRNMTRYYSIAAVFGGLMLVGANVLLWKSDFTQNMIQPGMLGGASSPLQLKITEVPRAAFQPNGDIEQPVTVRIDNPTSRTLPIPAIRARMMDSNDQPVFVWTFQPSQTHLPAGKSVNIQTRATNFPTDPLPVRLSLEFIDKART